MVCYIQSIEYQSAIKRTNNLYTNNLDRSQGNYDEQKTITVSKDHILHGCIYITFSEWQTIETENEVMISQG